MMNGIIVTRTTGFKFQVTELPSLESVRTGLRVLGLSESLSRHSARGGGGVPASFRRYHSAATVTVTDVRCGFRRGCGRQAAGAPPAEESSHRTTCRFRGILAPPPALTAGPRAPGPRAGPPRRGSRSLAVRPVRWPRPRPPSGPPGRPTRSLVATGPLWR